MHIKNSLLVIATLSMAALSAGTATATTITTNAVWTGGTAFALLHNWQTNITGAPTELPAFNSGTLPTPNGDGGITFTSAVGSFTASGTGLAETPYGSFPALSGQTINFSTPVAGINAFYMAFGSSDGSPITVTLSDGESIVLSPTPTAQGKVVLGLSISHTITSIGISTNSGSAAYIWDFDYGTSSLAQDLPQTPAAEAATAILIGIGLVSFGAGRRVLCAKTA